MIEKLSYKNKEIIYFKSFPQGIDFSKTSRKDFEKFPKGDTYALIGNDLYIKGFGGGRNYVLYKENFLPSKKSKTLESGLSK